MMKPCRKRLVGLVADSPALGECPKRFCAVTIPYLVRGRRRRDTRAAGAELWHRPNHADIGHAIGLRPINCRVLRIATRRKTPSSNGWEQHLSEHQFKGRREDLRLVTGLGRYTSDYNFSGQVAGHFLRADRAHAKIVKIDIADAKSLPGVLDVLTGADLAATGWKGAPAMSILDRKSVV